METVWQSTKQQLTLVIGTGFGIGDSGFWVDHHHAETVTNHLTLQQRLWRYHQSGITNRSTDTGDTSHLNGQLEETRNNHSWIEGILAFIQNSDDFRTPIGIVRTFTVGDGR